MPEIISVKPANLLADSNNPRIPEEGLGQREALRAIAKSQNDEILALARDIVSQKSVDPSALPIIVRASEPDHFVVLEGNRRLTAIRALENPVLFDGAFSGLVSQQIRKLSTAYQAAPLETINCCLMANAQEAEHWISLRHTGKNGGAGLVPWGPHEKSRHIARIRGQAGLHTRLLDLLENTGQISKDERRRVPNAAFERLVRTKAVRDKIGYSIDKQGRLEFKDEAAGVAALVHVARDLASRGTKTGDIYTMEQRVDYASKIPIGKTPPPTVAGSVAPSAPQTGQLPLIPAGAPTTPITGTGTKQPPMLRYTKERTILIPSDVRLKITEPRIRRMARELQTLDVNEFTNAAAVLFRVFLELSTEHYLVNTIKKSKNSLLQLRLSQKMLEVVTHLEKLNALDRQDAAPVRAACARKSFLATSVLSMNEYIHNYLMNPAPDDLRKTWDSLEPFIKALWP